MMIKRLLMVALVLVVASVSICGCLQPQPQAVPTPSATPMVKATPATPTAKPEQQTIIKEKTKVIVVPAKPKPQANTVRVYITGPTQIYEGQGATWNAIVIVNGVRLPQEKLINNIDWFIDGHAAGGWWGPSRFGGPGTLFTDADGSLSVWGFGTHTLNAEYLGDPSLPNTSMIVTVVP
jgi:hypothetical protein